jgi:hypothetical protein
MRTCCERNKVHVKKCSSTIFLFDVRPKDQNITTLRTQLKPNQLAMPKLLTYAR